MNARQTAAAAFYFNNVSVFGICHKLGQRFDVLSRVDRSGLAARGQRRAWKRGGYDTNCQQNRRDPKSCSVIQIFPPFLLRALSPLDSLRREICRMLSSYYARPIVSDNPRLRNRNL